MPSSDGGTKRGGGIKVGSVLSLKSLEDLVSLKKPKCWFYLAIYLLNHNKKQIVN